MNNKILIVIPSRYNSTRFIGKPLKKIELIINLNLFLLYIDLFVPETCLFSDLKKETSLYF